MRSLTTEIRAELAGRKPFRTARSFTSGEYLLRLAMTPTSQELESPGNLGRFTSVSPNRKIFEARKRETAALGAGEKLVLGHPLAATIGDSARCMQNLEKVLFTGPKTSDTVTFICD